MRIFYIAKNIKSNEIKKLRVNKDTKINFIGYQYKIIYFDKDKQSKIIGDFYAKYNYQIKFEAYRYLKKILQQNKICFGIYDVANDNIIWYSDITENITPSKIDDITIKSIYKVKKIKNIELKDLQECDSNLSFNLIKNEPTITETNSCFGTIL